jgi:hypothetical protein
MKVVVEKLPPIENRELMCQSWNGEFPCFNPPSRMVMRVGPLTFIHGASWKLFTCEKHLDQSLNTATVGGRYRVVYAKDL